MISKNYIFYFLLILLLGYHGFSQDEKREEKKLEEKQEKRIEEADENFARYAFVDARKIYVDVANKGYVSADLFKKIGDSYYFNSQLEEANVWYEKLVAQFADEIDPEYLFRYSQTLKSQERYEDADQIMLRFNELTGNDKRAADFVSTRDYLQFIEMQSGKYRLTKLNVNSNYSDYAPSFDHQGNIVFASSRNKGGMTVTVHEWNELPFLDLYTSPMIEKNGILQTPKRLKGKINTKFHESSTTFSKDGKTVYFTRNNYTGKKLLKNDQGTTLLKIYKATLEDDKWKNVVEVPFNSNEYSTAHPALSPDGTKLYFASDMPGSVGLSDLYVVDILGENEYGTPINLGDKINTEGRETFPFISESGRLYFASDGQVGLGGLDIFVAIPEFSSFSRPYNVGKPVNSSEDDFTFVINEDNKLGYFASNRNGGEGLDDIYSFKQLGELITSCNQYLEGTVTDAETKEVIPGAEIILMDDSNNEIDRTTADASGNYRIDLECEYNYVIRAIKENYKPTEVALSTNDALEYTHQMSIQLNKGNELGTEEVGLGDDLAKILQLQTIYFDLDKSAIRPDAEIELQKIISVMTEYPQIKVDVRSHTDSRASDAYNKRLSQRRANSTVDYIVTKGGIDRSRLSGKGYGETELVNACSNGVECTKEQHQMNRRSEFILVE